MKKIIFFASALALVYGAKAQTQTYTPMTLTGYNADVVAEGSGSASTSTNNDVDGINYAFAADNFVNPAGKSPSAGTALPTNGTINSATTSGLPFQLAAYNANNSLRIDNTTPATLTFTTPRSADNLYVLATSGSGISTVNMTVNFTDGTNQAFTGQSVSDWYNGSNSAFSGTTRVERTTDVLDVQTTGPRLYQYLLTLSSGNTTKLIQSITFTKTSTAGTLNVMGVTIKANAPAAANDVAVTAISGVNSGCGLTNQEIISVTVTNLGTAAQTNIPVSYSINGGTAVNEVFAGPLAPGASQTYTFTTKANLSTLGSYTIEAKTNLSGDAYTSNNASTKTVIAASAPNAPTITSGGTTTFCPGGSVVLTAASTASGATFKWYKDGTLITGANSASYTANAAGNYTATATIYSTCTSAQSAATTVAINQGPTTPTITAASNLSFCAGGSVILTANTTTGSTFIWYYNGAPISGATSANYTASANGNYTVKATLGSCSSAVSAATTVTVIAKPSTPTISKSGMVLTSSANAGNQWYKDGNIITGATAKTYTATTSGVYTVVVTSNGCSSNASTGVNLSATGLDDDYTALDVIVSPNPSTGLFNISLPHGKGDEMTVTDLTGKVVKQLSSKDKNTQINLNGSAKGIYLLKVVSNGRTFTRKIIVE